MLVLDLSSVALSSACSRPSKRSISRSTSAVQSCWPKACVVLTAEARSTSNTPPNRSASSQFASNNRILRPVRLSLACTASCLPCREVWTRSAGGVAGVGDRRALDGWLKPICHAVAVQNGHRARPLTYPKIAQHLGVTVGLWSASTNQVLCRGVSSRVFSAILESRLRRCRRITK